MRTYSIALSDRVEATPKGAKVESGVRTLRSSGRDAFLTQRAQLYLLTVIVMMQISSLVDRSAMAVLVQEIKHDLSLSDFEISLLQGLAFSLFYSTAGVFVASLADRLPRRPIMFAGVVLWSIAAAATGLARGFTSLFVARMAVGFSETSVGPCATSMFADGFPRRTLGRAIATYNAAGVAGLGVSLLATGWLLGRMESWRSLLPLGLSVLSPWRLVLITLALPGFFVALLAFTVTDPPRRRDLNQASAISWVDFCKIIIIGRGFFLRLLLANGLVTMVGYSTIAWAPSYARRVFHFSAAQVGSAMGIIVGVIGVASAVLGGVLVDYFYLRGRRDAALLVPIVGSLLAVPLAIAGYVDQSPAMFIAGVITIQCFVQSQYGPLLTAIQMGSPSLVRGRTYALFSLSSNFIGVALGPLAVGVLTDFVFRSEAKVGYSLAILNAVCLPVAIWLLLRARRPFMDILDQGRTQTSDTAAG